MIKKDKLSKLSKLIKLIKLIKLNNYQQINLLQSKSKNIILNVIYNQHYEQEIFSRMNILLV
jgi:hypothetical protein